MWISTRSRSQEIDQRAESEFGLSTPFLMEKAGMAVYEAIAEMLPETGRLAVFCGRGNNGGDGFVSARAAHENGYQVECIVAGLETELSKDSAEQMMIARSSGVNITFSDDPRFPRRLECLSCRELIVDALLGTGLKKPVHGIIRDAIQAINRSGVPVLSIDCPSGIDCDTGEELGESVWALRTITLGTPKPFLFQGIGLEHSGYWSVANIGLPNALADEPTNAKLMEANWVANLLPERLRQSNKGDNGTVLIVAGSKAMPGSAIMATLAAMRSGAGLVMVAAIPCVCDRVTQRVPEAIFIPLPEKDGVISPDAAEEILAVQSRVDSAIFGPGLSHKPHLVDLLRKVWPQWEKPCVIDADALNMISAGLEPPKCECVFTPHPGEMSRLMKVSIAEIQSDRFQTMEMATKKYGTCILLKGAHTLVGEPDQPILVNATGNSGMAAGGMGDVLSGVIGTLLAQELPPYYAASCGVYWHGEAGDLCAEEIGSIGFTAAEVADHLPGARSRITEC